MCAALQSLIKRMRPARSYRAAIFAILLIAVNPCLAPRAVCEISAQTLQFETKPTVYLLSALATDDSDSPEFTQSSALLRLKLVDLLSIMRNFVPGLMPAYQWFSYRNLLVSEIESLRQFDQLRVMTVGGIFGLERTRLGTVMQIRRDIRSLWSELKPKLEATPPDQDGVSSNISTASKVLVSVLAEVMRITQEFQAQNVEKLHAQDQKAKIGESVEAPGPLLKKLSGLLLRLSPWYRVIIKTHVTQHDLAEALSDKAVAGLFWIGHANSGGQGFTVDNISDVDGVNVKSLFAHLPPTLRYLTLVGCRAKPILEGFKAKGAYEANPDLIIDAEDDKTLLSMGSLQAAQRLLRQLMTDHPQEITRETLTPRSWQPTYVPPAMNSTTMYQCRESVGPALPFSVHALMNEASGKPYDVRVELDGEMLTYLPSTELGRPASGWIESRLLKGKGIAYLTVTAYSSGKDLKSGESSLDFKRPSVQFDFGTGITAVPIMLPNGEPLGDSMQVYKLTLLNDNVKFERHSRCHANPSKVP